ncbi:Zinc finger, FYVE/PHD-type [Cynara cardunculus var. scolymus]|uniref:Zinc finger, FYVE/PHD-type n=1 Tax=Cynara cardunculus var. scolymus TaxID=59895 RepID=A0A103YKW6_CYNCS|nr:Zinc finger, FYVE/PHD-type [Cynara cardunculus var. scolymus]
MAKGNRVGVKGSNLRRIQQRGQDSEESDEEYKVTEDEDCDESDECYSLDGDESEEILADFEESRRVVRSRSTRRTSSGRKGDEIKKPRKKRRVLHTKDEVEDDDDDEEEDEEFNDEDDAEFMSLDRKSDHIKKPREKKRISYTELDDEEEEDYEELVPSGRRRNLRKKHQEKKRVLDTEDDEDDDAEFMHLGRKVSQEKKLREKRKVLYTEDDDEDADADEDEDDSEFMCTSRKGNLTKETREKRTVSYKEDNQEEEDENDAEFVLSEGDFVDYDDESPKMKKNESISRHHPQKRSVGGGRKKSKKSKIKKPTRPKQRNRRVGQKSGSSKERPATNKNQVEKRSKKIPRRRKQRVTAESDSDFVSSPSLDHEYTISEEEREQMREASVYCANLRAKLRSSSCGKHEEEPVFEQRKNPVRKGKEKVEDMKDEVGKQVCGICLSEEGKRTVRGVLNCCRHYFCFSCIMEWSKVESRCPLCKQRFATITKAAKSDTGFDLRTVVVPVPECDQVYQPSEEELRGYLDPYESVICTECHHGGDDALMLLCDICDSPAHTFCVGLGREVPEGNWYCEGCRPTVFGSLSSQRPTPTSDRRSSGIASDLPSPTAGGFDLNELYVPETPLTQQSRVLPEPRLPGGDFMPAPAGTVATTLRDRRRIHRQMHHRLLTNNRMSDLVARSSRTPPSSSGIRLFGSQLDQARDSTPQRNVHPHASFNGREDHVMSSMHDINLLSPRVDQFGVQVQDSSLPAVDVSLQAEHSGSGMAFDSRLGFAQLHPCTNRSSIGSDASLSPYACREVSHFNLAIGSSRTSGGGFHAPY